MSMEVGKVKWFNDAKGFGFIKRDTDEDVFVHYTAIEGTGFRSLYEGQEVEFELTQGPKGLLAKKVIKLERKNALAGEDNLESGETAATA